MTAVKPVIPLLDRTPLDALPIEHLCDLGIDLETPHLIPTPLGTRMTFISKRGRLDGPRLRGELLPGGGDWLTLGPDGISRLDIRGTIRTDDGALIHYASLGVSILSVEGRDDFLSGKRVSFDDSYVRTTPRFETADERYAWLNGLVFVAHNELSGNHIDYRIYQVL